MARVDQSSRHCGGASGIDPCRRNTASRRHWTQPQVASITPARCRVTPANRICFWAGRRLHAPTVGLAVRSTARRATAATVNHGQNGAGQAQDHDRARSLLDRRPSHLAQIREDASIYHFIDDRSVSSTDATVHTTSVRHATGHMEENLRVSTTSQSPILAENARPFT